jgi:mono/diheme cytochrome c family protein
MRRMAAVTFLLMTAACDRGQNFSEPEPGLERMMDQRRADPYGPFMRPPPEGAVPTNRIIGSGTPPPMTLELLQRGEDRYNAICANCHGLLGNADTPVARAMRLVRPRDLHLPYVKEYSVGRIYSVVTEGFGLMPSYTTHLSRSDRWAVAAYVKALQLSQGSELTRLPESLRREFNEATR